MDYLIDAEHVARLRQIATRLYSERRLNGDEMRDLGHAITAIADRVEQLPWPDAL